MEFREKLKEITDQYNIRNNISKQIQLISDLSKIYPHSIKLVEEANRKYNCYMYAFNINYNQENLIIQISKKYRTIYPNSEFIKFCISKGYLTEISFNKAKNDDIIIYFDDTGPKHAGKIKNRKVVSKWGADGHLWEHNIWEVPFNYGNQIKYFRDIPIEEVTNYFLNYAKSRGVKNFKNFQKARIK